MSLLILLRHGQSMWNQKNVFTGWVDVPLSKQGIQEAINAGKKLTNTQIDMIFTSTLVRAQQTAMIAFSEHSSGKVPVVIHNNPEQAEKSVIYNNAEKNHTIPTYIDWRLNERYYGELQGLNKDETKQQYGEEQVKVWRRSYDTPPPNGESLQMTCQRTLPCLNERIIPQLKQGRHCLVSAHGNSLRSIVMEIEQLNEAEVLNLEIATGKPIVYNYNNDTWDKLAEFSS
jgi:2,3-bisphosphoglycerate-dependent phosphoglycerate mutase